jgi:hypothetical protein
MCTVSTTVAVAGVDPAVNGLQNAVSPACPQDFYSKECWAHHPLPYADFVDFKKQERAELEAERKKLVHA